VFENDGKNEGKPIIPSKTLVFAAACDDDGSEEEGQ
jgi:hypothetical protein